MTGTDVDNNSSTTVFDGKMHPLIVEKIVIFCCILPLIISFGVFGNIMTLIVLFKGKKANPTSIYIANLAAADLMTLCIRFACLVSVLWQIFRPEVYASWKVNSYSIFMLSYFSEKISKCITVAIVFDRIVAVKWPFRYKTICTARRTIIAMVAIYVVLISTSFPIICDIFAYFRTDKVNISSSEYPTTAHEIKQYMTSRLYKIYILYILANVNRVIEFSIIPVIIIGNIVIVRGLRKLASVNPSYKTNSVERKRQERQTTKLCLTISFTFLSLCLPFDIFGVFLLTGVVPMNHTAQVFLDIFATLTTVNSSVNFVIYALMNTKYRQAYKAVLPCRARETSQESADGQVGQRSRRATATITSDLKFDGENSRATTQFSRKIQLGEENVRQTTQSSRNLQVCRVNDRKITKFNLIRQVDVTTQVTRDSHTSGENTYTSSIAHLKGRNARAGKQVIPEKLEVKENDEVTGYVSLEKHIDGNNSQQGTLTLPDTWFRPQFWDLLMLQLLRPNSSNLPCLYSTFHLEYPLVLSRFYLRHRTFQLWPKRLFMQKRTPIRGNKTVYTTIAQL